MDFVITNFETGEQTTVAKGASLVVTFPTGGPAGGTRALLIEGVEFEESGDDAKAALEASVTSMWAIRGDMSEVGSGLGSLSRFIRDGGHWTPQVEVPVNVAGTVLPGDYRFTVRFLQVWRGEFSSFQLIVRLVPRGMFAPKLAWVPAGMIDLQVDLDTQKVRSSALSSTAQPIADTSYVPVLSVGAELTFAVVITLGGVVIGADVTEITIALRISNEFEEPKLIEFTGSAADLETVGGDHYYGVSGTLASGDLTTAFIDRNADPVDTDNPNRVRALPCMAQITVTHDGSKYVSEHFDVMLLQPVDDSLLG